MQLHPPAFEGRHQRLNLMGFTHHRVPEQKTHRSADYQHHKSTQRPGFVLVFKVKVKRGRHPAEQHKHLVQIANRDVADVSTNQIAFIPPHHGANQRHAHCHPGDFGPHGVKRGTGANVHALSFGIGLFPPRKHADPVKNCAHEKQHAHPQNGRLAGQKILEPEHLLGPAQIPLVGRNAQQ